MSGSLLIYAPVPVHLQDGVLYVERQAANGLRLWAAHFDHVTAIMPVSPEPVPTGWIPLTDAPDLDRVTLETVPMAYRPDQYLKARGKVRAQLRDWIDRSDYMAFAIGGLFGDWGAEACLIAHKAGRKFAVWTDRVESEVVRDGIATATGRAKLRAQLTHRPMAMLERHVIGKATLGLFHGKETFDTYAPFCANPQIVHDIHISPRDHIQPDQLSDKIAGAGAGALQIFYAGRADPMKGPLDWIDVLARLNASGVMFQATWLGAGSELQAMQDRVAALELTDKVSFPGFLDSRYAVMEAYRAAQIFLFCHKTPESPRCLIEALASGTPIVGYAGAYARDLIAQHDGGRLVLMDDVQGLADEIAALDADRDALAGLIGQAAKDGAPFTDEHVFEHRSELIKTYL